MRPYLTLWGNRYRIIKKKPHIAALTETVAQPEKQTVSQG